MISPSSVFGKIYYFFIGIIMAICMTFDIPMRAIGKPVDLTGYELVWNDEFEGDALDTTKWKGHGQDLNGVPRQQYEGAYSCSDALEVKDGYLTISIRKEDGSKPDRPAGWYFASIDTQGLAEFTYGYFECRAKLAKAKAGNCAFWLNSPYAYDGVSGSDAGVEIDIMESMRYGVAHEGSIENNMHYFDANGHQFIHARWIIVDGNPYEEFHTYSVKWTPSGYTFYVDGKECRNTDFGISNGAEYIILSSFMRESTNQYIVGDSADFVVDYVRVYQQTG